MEPFVTVAAFTNPIEAELAAGRLDGEGIEVVLSGDLAASAFSGFGSIGGRVELRVRAGDAERATSLLATPAVEEEEFDPNIPPPGEEDDLWVCTLCGDAVGLDEDICPACGTPREAIREEAGGSRDIRGDVPAGAAERGPASEDIAPGLPPIPAYELAEDDLELPDPETFLGDDLVNRAFRAAFFGLILSPLMLYALWLLGSLATFRGELSPAGMRKLWWTLLVVGLFCLLQVFVCTALLQPLYW